MKTKALRRYKSLRISAETYSMLQRLAATTHRSILKVVQLAAERLREDELFELHANQRKERTS